MIENTRTGEIAYVGATFAESEHFWLDGMLEVFADSWDMEQHKVVSQQVGYYGIDCRNMYDCTWKVRVEIVLSLRAEKYPRERRSTFSG